MMGVAGVLGAALLCTIHGATIEINLHHVESCEFSEQIVVCRSLFVQCKFHEEILALEFCFNIKIFYSI